MKHNLGKSSLTLSPMIQKPEIPNITVSYALEKAGTLPKLARLSGLSKVTLRLWGKRKSQDIKASLILIGALSDENPPFTSGKDLYSLYQYPNLGKELGVSDIQFRHNWSKQRKLKKRIQNLLKGWYIVKRCKEQRGKDNERA